MGINNDSITAQHILKLIDEGHIKAMTVKKSSISADFMKKMKKSGWYSIRIDPDGDNLKCYFARE
jgi:MoaA/NifB/PqqE/SkfB family radical SAM enzyme